MIPQCFHLAPVQEKIMKLYMRVTRDKYELPEAVADSVKELADMLGVKDSMIHSILSKCKAGRISHSVYKVVEVDDE